MDRSLHHEALAALDRALTAAGSERQALLEHALFLHRVALEMERVAGHANNNEPEERRRRA